MQTTFLALPLEVKANILRYTDLVTLASAIRSHSSLNAAWKAFSQDISRAISITEGFADAKTAGATDPVQPRGWSIKRNLDRETSGDELAQVIREQRSMTGALDHVRDWTTYARTVSQIHKRWKTGRTALQTIKQLDMGAAKRFGLPGLPSFWRFKIDPISRWYIVTGSDGGVWAFDTDGKLEWCTTFITGHKGHVELTHDGTVSYMSTAIGSRRFLIWRFHDPTKLDPSNPPPEGKITPELFETICSRTTVLNPVGRGFHPYMIVGTGSLARASKLRYPFFLASAQGEENPLTFSVCRWNLVQDSGAGQSISLDYKDIGEFGVLYLELDYHSIFAAGMNTITSASFDETGYRYWPPAPPQDHRELQPLSPASLYRASDEAEAEGRAWTAVHHDSKERFVVGASSFFSPRRSGDHPDGVDLISQLSVENDRVVFVASSKIGHALFLLNLEPFDTITAFVQNPPELFCLQYPLPCVQEPQRVEQTSCEVYVSIESYPTVTDEVPSLRTNPMAETLSITRSHMCVFFDATSRDWITSGFKHPFPYQWKTLDGQTVLASDPSTTFTWNPPRRYHGHAESLVDYFLPGDEVNSLRPRWSLIQSLAAQNDRLVERLGIDTPGLRTGTDAILEFRFCDPPA
ncbi:uncharacterized protein JCM15063_000005 [Sporobolomyces koalae]|uniref:uncharacterized protein n=1 Tax=Sporobolomyces koalae TaxID=500713 RepID=UPI00317535DC